VGRWGNEHIPPRQPDGTSRLLVKGAVRMTNDANSAKKGVNNESMEGRWCGGRNLTQKTRTGTTHHTIQPGAHTLKLYSMKTVASARHYPSHANAQAHCKLRQSKTLEVWKLVEVREVGT
jgi:hypothetical protein